MLNVKVKDKATKWLHEEVSSGRMVMTVVKCKANYKALEDFQKFLLTQT